MCDVIPDVLPPVYVNVTFSGAYPDVTLGLKLAFGRAASAVEGIKSANTTHIAIILFIFTSFTYLFEFWVNIYAVLMKKRIKSIPNIISGNLDVP